MKCPKRIISYLNSWLKVKDYQNVTVRIQIKPTQSGTETQSTKQVLVSPLAIKTDNYAMIGSHMASKRRVIQDNNYRP